MPVEIKLTALSAGMGEATIARWLKAEGADVREGEVIAEIETDKATMELEASASGRLVRILVANGGHAAVGEVIAVLGLHGETADMLSWGASPPAPPVVSLPGAASEEKPVAAQGQLQGGPDLEATSVRKTVKASPLARRLAAGAGLTLAEITGSGPGGRIVRVDVERAVGSLASAKSVPAETPSVVPVDAVAPAVETAVPPGIGTFESIPHSSMRRTIARRLTEAKTTIPHFYLNVDCDMDALFALRGTINAARPEANRLSVNDFVVKACANALRAVPEVNVIWTSDAMLKLSGVDIAVAVATEGGLFTPVVRNADQKSLGALSADVKALAAKAKEGRLKPEEYQGGALSVSNLGMYGVNSFAAIINPPQSAILAVGAAERRPVEREGALVFVSMMRCTLSVDHRAIDGALAAQFLAAFKSAIENPLQILA